MESWRPLHEVVSVLCFAIDEIDIYLCSNLVAFHYGNLTHPSVDPPRIGFLSMVPNNADALLDQAVDDAEANGGAFDSKSK